MHSQKGQILIMALIALVLGALLVTPLLGQASASLLATGLMAPQLVRSASCEAGVLHGMWRLRYESGFRDLITELNSVTYTINVNGVDVPVTVSWVEPLEPEPTPTPTCDGTQCDRVEVSKVPDPPRVPSGQPATVTYTITIENVGKNENCSEIHIWEVGDRLPPGFTYVPGSTGGDLIAADPDVISFDPDPCDDPDTCVQTVEWEWWDKGTHPTTAAGEVVSHHFDAVIQNPDNWTVYYNLGWVHFTPDSIGIVYTGGADAAVTSALPRYDIEATYGGMTIRARVNLAEEPSPSISVVSWNVH